MTTVPLYRALYAKKKKKKRILGECLLISSLAGKALRTLVEWLGLARDSTCFLETELSELDIKRHKAGILFISLQVGSLLTLAIMT